MQPTVLDRRRRMTSGFVLRLLLAALYLFTVSGMPLPLSEALSESMVRYPCEDSPCGCKSAEQCWRSCCCNTLEAKLAWAVRNGVTPPTFIKRLVSGNPSHHANGVQEQTTDNCQLAQREKKLRGCCQMAATDQASGAVQRNAQPVVIVQSLACDGNPFGLPGVAPAVPSADLASRLNPQRGEHVRASPRLLLSRSSDPPPQPPPKTI